MEEKENSVIDNKNEKTENQIPLSEDFSVDMSKYPNMNRKE